MISDRVTGTLLFAFSLWFGYEASGFTVGFMADPIGPKAFPLLLAVLMAVTSPFLIFRPEEDPKWPRPRILLALAAVFVSFVFYAYMLVPLGFIPATTLEVGLLGVLFGARPLKSAAAALCLSLVLYGTFVHLLGIPLPVGKIWGF